MKDYLNTAVFGQQLQRALEAMRDEIQTLPWFKTRRYRVYSGADFVLLWNYRHPDDPIVANTARNWITGKRFPEKRNWVLLTKLVHRSEAWLRGWDADAKNHRSAEAAQNPPVYFDRDKPRRRRTLIDEIDERLQELKSLD